MIEFIIGLIVGCIILFLIIRPKLTKISIDNSQEIEKNKILKQDNQQLEQQQNKLTIEVKELNNTKNALKDTINDLSDQANQSANIFYQQTKALAEERIGKAIETIGKEYQDAEADYQNAYLEMLQSLALETSVLTENYKTEIKELTGQLNDLQSKVESAVEASKRAEEIKNQKDFYKLVLPQADIDEINKLHDVVQYLRDAEPLNKVIWKVYYEKPYTDLIGRVVGNDIATGIYKITNLENEKCYVGQAVDIAARWKQHIKRGLGAEAPTRNKLYPAMMEYGVENFSFEIIEKCPREQLNEKEDFWQDYFKAKIYGYSIK